MMLKNMMEDKQLDFNRPLLSVRTRRTSSGVPPSDSRCGRNVDNSLPKIPPIPAYKSELKSGPIRNPGTVPFLWEQTPGRPKDETLQNRPPKGPPLVPKLPPGRIADVKNGKLDPTHKADKALQSKTNTAVTSCPSGSSSSIDVGKDEKFEDRLEDRGSSDSDSYSEAYVDARDTLSRTESSLNFSLSGLSGLDGPDIKSSRTFSPDPQTMDFMMGRFLPAAKAMASDSPQHPTRKQHVVLAQEPPKEVINVVNKVKHCPVKLKALPPNILLHHIQNEGSDSDDEIDDYVKDDYLSAKLCGLLPRLCLKGSYGLISPVPGLKVQTGAPISAGHRSRVKSICANSFTGTESQLAEDVANERRSKGGHRNHDSHADKMVSKRDHQKQDGSSLYRRLQDAASISSDQNSHFQSSPSEERVSTMIPKICDNSKKNEPDPHSKTPSNFRELLASDDDECESPPVSSIVEKTLYIDSVNKIGSPISVGSDTGPNEVNNCKDGDSKHADVSDLSFQDSKHLNGADADDASGDSLPSSIEVNDEVHLDTEKCSGPKPDNLQETSSLAIFQVRDDGKIDLEKKLPKKSDKGISQGPSLQSLLPPPLPKSPSESWLQRTLPALSLKNPSSRSSLGIGNNMKVQSPNAKWEKVQSTNAKWETIVKTSNSYHGHLRFSEELLTPIPEA